MNVFLELNLERIDIFSYFHEVRGVADLHERRSAWSGARDKAPGLIRAIGKYRRIMPCMQRRNFRLRVM